MFFIRCHPGTVNLQIGTFDNVTVPSSDGIATLEAAATGAASLVTTDSTGATSASPTSGTRTTTAQGA